jgi:hypothetical protein
VKIKTHAFVDFHRLDARVKLLGQGVEDEVAVFVDADQIAGLDGVDVDDARHRQIDGLRLDRR